MTDSTAPTRSAESSPGLYLAASSGQTLPRPDRVDCVNDDFAPKPPRQRRKKTTREKDNTEYLGFLRRAIKAAGERVKAEDPSTLAELVALQDELNRVIRDAARSLHDDHDYSWGDIAYELKVTRQAAYQRWGRRGQ